MSDNPAKEAGSSPMPSKYSIESPTTARPLSFDDDAQDSTAPQQKATSPAPQQQQQQQQQEEEQAPPPKPPRPVSARQQAEQTLKEAFPAIDQAVIRAVLVASGGDVERSFHALLGMSDPAAQSDELPPPQPKRPSPADVERRRQVEADENYARMLAEQLGHPATHPRQQSHDARSAPNRQPRETGLKPNELYDEDHDFFRDDLPVIQENIRKGFMETQTKVNSFFANLKKKFDGEEGDDDHEYYGDQPSQSYSQGQYNRYGRESGGRLSGERDRYDADARELGDGFSTLELRDAEVHQQASRLPRRPPRPANPEMFSMDDPSKPARRRVSFLEGPPEEIPPKPFSEKDNAESSSAGSSKTEDKGTPLTKAKKWQPLSVIEPSPIVDSDPFQLGDSDDEGEPLKAKEKGEKEEEKKDGLSSPKKLQEEEKKAGADPTAESTEKTKATSTDGS
ncbi:ubiquitin-binding protein cue5 [Ascosphaera pollenicola]|nr:ubiquitin-binding protein cue5 [Ascosphaera pollenicola]